MSVTTSRRIAILTSTLAMLLVVMVATARPQVLDDEATRYDEVMQRLDDAMERLDDAAMRDDEVMRQLDDIQRQLNLRDPVWRAATLKRCRERGLLETSPLCGRLRHEQTWWEWLWALSGYSSSSAVVSEPIASRPATTVASRPTSATSAGRYSLAAVPTPLPTAIEDSESSITILRPDGTPKERLIYDKSGAFRRSERFDKSRPVE